MRLLVVVLVLTVAAFGCSPPDSSEAGDPAGAPEPAGGSATSQDRAAGGAAAARVRPDAVQTGLTTGDTIPGRPGWTEQDYEVLERTVRWAYDQGIDTLPVGLRIARIGRRFVGTAYIPRTLDPPGPERLIINLRALDCVTYVEGMLTLARLVRSESPDVVDRPHDLMDRYESILTHVRYRGGRMNGYASRLHYFSEWIADAERKGLVRDVTGELGGVEDPEAIDFMTTHRSAYDQLADDEIFRAVAEAEERLGAGTRLYIPQERVRAVRERIRTGDIIAATSTVEGLDIAHTGIAVWDGGVLRLMHAPLVGEAVQVSERPLADRLVEMDGQDGLMVARPLEHEF